MCIISHLNVVVTFDSIKRPIYFAHPSVASHPGALYNKFVMVNLLDKRNQIVTGLLLVMGGYRKYFYLFNTKRSSLLSYNHSYMQSSVIMLL